MMGCRFAAAAAVSSLAFAGSVFVRGFVGGVKGTFVFVPERLYEFLRQNT